MGQRAAGADDLELKSAETSMDSSFEGTTEKKRSLGAAASQER